MKTNARAVALSLAIATSGLYGATLAGAETDQTDRKMEVQAAAKPTAETPDPAAARRALLAELRRLTPEQKKQLGEDRVRHAQHLSGAQLVANGCFSHGVFCKGLPAFTHGVICCALKKKG